MFLICPPNCQIRAFRYFQPCWVTTAEPARLDAQHHRAALPRQVAQGPFVMAVELARHRAAIGTGGRRGQRLGENGDAFRGGQDLHNGQARRDQGQEALGQRELSRRGVFLSCAHLTPQRLRNSTENAAEPKVHCHSHTNRLLTASEFHRLADAVCQAELKTFSNAFSARERQVVQIG